MAETQRLIDAVNRHTAQMTQQPPRRHRCCVSYSGSSVLYALEFCHVRGWSAK